MTRYSLALACCLAASMLACGDKNNEPAPNAANADNGMTNNTSTNNQNNTTTECEGDDDCDAGEICDDGVCVDGSSCGDGTIQDDEACDGTDLGEATCESATGLGSGELSCTTDCELDASGCFDCGDGAVDGPEVCDGIELGGATCESEGFGGGELSCAADCESVTTEACWTCGDGVCDLALGENTATCPQDCGWADISVGGDGITAHVCATKHDGTVWCWGSNESGQLGDGTLDASAVPTQVRTIDNAVMVDLGERHSCAIGAQGEAWCWGLNIFGQLGNGSTINATTPEVVFLEGDPATTISAGPRHTCAIATRNALPTALCWGNNSASQLGDGTTEQRLIPTAISPTMTSISTGRFNGCGIDAATSEAYCWGNNADGQVGDGTLFEPRPSPVRVAPPDGLDVVAIAVGEGAACAVTPDGATWCWGDNGATTLGRDDVTRSEVPVMPMGLDDVIATDVTLGRYTPCVLASGTAYCWGHNASGQLGDGTTMFNTTAAALSLTDVVAISTGETNSCAVTADGAAYCWAGNQYGQIGDGTMGDNVLTPTLVSDPYAAP